MQASIMSQSKSASSQDSVFDQVFMMSEDLTWSGILPTFRQ